MNFFTHRDVISFSIVEVGSAPFPPIFLAIDKRCKGVLLPIPHTQLGTETFHNAVQSQNVTFSPLFPIFFPPE